MLLSRVCAPGLSSTMCRGTGQNGMVIAETFHTPLAIDLVAVGVGSLQGAMYAAGFKRIDLLGVAIIGIAVGIGGGFLRDILLNVPPAALSLIHI